MKIEKLIVIVISVSLIGCASSPQVIIDPSSIRDTTAYIKDMDECRAISKSYDMSGATTGSAAIGAGAAVGTAALVLATGGLYLLPAGILIAGAGGATVGGGMSQSKETSAREKIWANCMTDRGYKAYTS